MIEREIHRPLKFMARWDAILSSGKLYLGICCLLAGPIGALFSLLEGQTIILLAIFGIILISNSVRDKRRKF